MSSSNDAKPDSYSVNARICRLVERCPFMYDRSHPQYLKKEVCDEAWLRIAKEMNDSVATCRERWRNIRTSFARSINTNKTPCSANRTKPYYLHEELKFLARHITPGVPVTRRYKRKHTSRSGGDDLLEVGVDEDTFNGFEHNDAQNGHDADDSHDSILVGDHMVDDAASMSDKRAEDTCGASTKRDGSMMQLDAHHNRLAQLPPPPLQAAPIAALHRDADETAAAAALQQIRMSTSSIFTTPARVENDMIGIDMLGNDSKMSVSSESLKRSRIELGTAAAHVTVDLQEESQPAVPMCVLPHEPSTTAKSHIESDPDAAFLNEIRNEMKCMDRRQKLHFKRRVYKALADNYPMPKHSMTATAATMTTACCPETSVANVASSVRRIEKMCCDMYGGLVRSFGNSAEAVIGTSAASANTANITNAATTSTALEHGHDTARQKRNPRSTANATAVATRSFTAAGRRKTALNATNGHHDDIKNEDEHSDSN